MRIWLARIAAAACSLILLVLAQGTAQAAVENFYGVNAQHVFDLSSSVRDQALSSMAGGGLQVVRHDASWGTAEPVAPNRSTGVHVYQWATFDSQVTAYARVGLRWLPTIDYSAPWASESVGNPFFPPARNSDYTAYA
ncbi:MAG: hypothetical protein ABR581_11615, partial [Thermoleophilaceae bacterium]